LKNKASVYQVGHFLSLSVTGIPEYLKNIGDLLVRLSLWILSIVKCYKKTKIKHDVSETEFVLETKSKHSVVLHVSYNRREIQTIVFTPVPFRNFEIS